jgi:hypothetical protein
MSNVKEGKISEIGKNTLNMMKKQTNGRLLRNDGVKDFIFFKLEMINPYKNSGLAKVNNFRNRYLDDEELQKPSQEVADQLNKKAQNKINEIIGIKT